MNLLNKTLIAVILLAFTASVAVSQDFVQLTDKYHCGRLADGKLHVVILNATGYSIVKKGSALKFIATQIASADQRLELVEELRLKFIKNGIDDKLISKTDSIVKSIGLEPEPIEDLEGVRIYFEKIKATLKARRQLLNFHRNNVKSCENNKLPGIESVSGSFTTYYARSTLNSSVGIIVRIPQVNKKQDVVGLCIESRNALFPDPARRDERYVAFIGVTSAPFCLGSNLNPPDKNGCTGNDVSIPGLLTGYFPKFNHNTGSVLGPDPASDSIQAQMAAVASANWDFKIYVSGTKETGTLCENLRNQQ